MARIQVKTISKTYWTTHDRRFEPNFASPAPRIPGNCDIWFPYFELAKIDGSPVRRNKPWNEKERGRDVGQKGLVGGEQEVYKSVCGPIRPRKTFCDLRPTNETVPLKFFHAFTTRTRTAFVIVRDYSRVVKWKWRTIEARGGERRVRGSFFFLFFVIYDLVISWIFFFCSFFRLNDCLNDSTFEIFREI